MAMPFIAILLTLILLAFLLTSRGRGSRRRPDHASGHARRVIRFAGPVLGVGLLAVMAFGTLQSVQRAYEKPAAFAEGGFDVPTAFLPGAPVSAREELVSRVDAGLPTSLIVHVILAEYHGFGLRPIDGGTLRYHGASGDLGVERMLREVSGASVLVELEPGDLLRSEEGTRVRFGGSVQFRDFTTSAHLGVSARAELGTMVPIGKFFVGRKRGDFFSLSPTRQRRLVVLAVPQLVPAGEDALTELPIDALVESAGGFPDVKWDGLSGMSASASAPGLSLAIYLGKASFTLMAAALLIMSFFRHRTLALAGIAFFLVIFTVGIDRWMIGVHAERATNEEMEIATRCTAAELLGYSFFFRDTASAVAARLASDESQPGLLRSVAGETVASLDRVR